MPPSKATAKGKERQKNNELMRKYPLEKAENILSTIPELSRTRARTGTPKAAEADENATDVKKLKSPPEEMIEDASATTMRGGASVCTSLSTSKDLEHARSA